MNPKRRKISSWRYPAMRRRPKTVACFCNMRAEDTISNITIFLDMVMSRCYSPFVKVTEHPIERQMRERLHHEVKRAHEIKERMSALASAYNEFLDLRKELEERKARTAVIYGLIGDDVQSLDPNSVELSSRLLVGGNDKSLRAQLPLWEAMKEYLQ